ncbi:uncharacterized protein Tco025E_01350 [Trypanosoma conorhini]|uniref:FYVE-type domain-containing protein n=1 Tax=Trypanosoma conorhini TaxID=83891 RepID=A0A3R7P002_9TRYP|nr:uncharacterized protein Tco025E_01350 [Trypanosoma conorhini]RNF26580.1 hypothetical protein Tco025E_01350 [Trypanosoma conorhini]
MTSASACPLCKRPFGLFLWRHECGYCKKTVCDDCAPKVKDHRQCSACAARVKQQQQTQQPRRTSNPASAEGERAARMRAAEERMKAAQQRGRPQSRGGQAPVLPVAEPASRMSQQQQCYTGASPSPQADVPTRANPAENPVLAAALRRRQQEQFGGNANRGNSAEKMQLLTAILAVLHQRGEDEPFGLRSMDETKLQAYLRYLKSKDKSPAAS